MRHSFRAVVNPFPTALLDGGTHAIDAHALIVVAANHQDGGEVMKTANEITQAAQLGGTVHQVTAEQHQVWTASLSRIQHLPAQCVGAAASEMNVADVQQAARVVARREPLLANVKGAMKPDLEGSGRQLARTDDRLGAQIEGGPALTRSGRDGAV